MEKRRRERILILAKTYPSPSSKYSETSCVAGITDTGVMRRLFPVPFRLIEHGQQFKKWQWIETLVEKAPADRRRESHKIYIDTISVQEIIEPKRNWTDRLPWIDKIPSFTNFDDIEASRLEHGTTLALLRPKHLLELAISDADRPDWTDEEKAILLKDGMQGKLFTEEETRQHIKELRKVPYNFHYRYVCDSPEGEKTFLHKIIDWEAGMLFWNCRKDHGKEWEKPFRAKLGEQLPNKDLMFLMGNQHRFPHQWLIISVIYPPKQKPTDSSQDSFQF
ncbi:MAG: hypothetical protein HY847_19865 [Betaproteobacteria bacterium]|nr:hypothetical protein [Betaproteobacteria bacterium]